MYLPKVDIYNALCAVTANVVQGSQTTFTSTPAITFTISDNSTELNLSNTIASQTIIVSVDIWTDTSVAGSNLLSSTEQAMRNLGYKMTYSSDIPYPEGALHHINCRFETTR